MAWRSCAFTMNDSCWLAIALVNVIVAGIFVPSASGLRHHRVDKAADTTVVVPLCRINERPITGAAATQSLATRSAVAIHSKAFVVLASAGYSHDLPLPPKPLRTLATVCAMMAFCLVVYFMIYPKRFSMLPIVRRQKDILLLNGRNMMILSFVVHRTAILADCSLPLPAGLRSRASAGDDTLAFSTQAAK